MKFEHVGHDLEDARMYRKMVGSLIYLFITRLDLSYVVGFKRDSIKVVCQSQSL